jgi:hypothetical protein
MKKQVKKIAGLLLLGLIAVSLISCGTSGTSTEDLAEWVQETYVEQWAEEDLPISIEKDLILVKKSDTEYTGLMTVSAYGESEQVTVNVVFDGEAFSSEIEGW